MTATEYLEQIQRNRRASLERIVKSFARPYVKRAARELDVSTDALNSMRSGRWDICEKRARLIEQKLGLEFGEMDRSEA